MSRIRKLQTLNLIRSSDKNDKTNLFYRCTGLKVTDAIWLKPLSKVGYMKGKTRLNYINASLLDEDVWQRCRCVLNLILLVNAFVPFASV